MTSAAKGDIMRDVNEEERSVLTVPHSELGPILKGSVSLLC